MTGAFIDCPPTARAAGPWQAAAPDGAAPPAELHAGSRETLLLAPRQLGAHLQWLQDTALAPGSAPASQLAQRWREAAAVYETLQRSEAGAADGAAVQPLPAAVARHARRLAGTAAFRNSHACVPVAFGMVPLDRLVVSQFSLTQSQVDALGSACARPCSLQQLAALCLPLQAPPADCRLVARDEGDFVFRGPAHDLRFLGPALLAGPALQGLALAGHPQAGLALALGRSCNLLEVVRHAGRLVLNNGHHRAHALRRAGHTHAPCLIQVCASHDELPLVAQDEITQHSDLYFEAPRPPMLVDFDNPALTQVLSTPALQREIRVSFRIDSRLVAA